LCQALSAEEALMLAIHPKARTTPAVRAEIARSSEPTGVLARRYGVSTETIRKWRKRGPASCQDRSSRPHKLPWKASEEERAEERAIVCALRRATGFPLDDLTFVVSPFLPHLNRDAVYRTKVCSIQGRPSMTKPIKPKRYEAGLAPHPQDTEDQVMALDLPPADLSEPMQAYFEKCDQKTALSQTCYAPMRTTTPG